MNTDIEKLDMIKAEVNKIFKSKTVKNAMQERLDWEELEKIEKSLEDDCEDLQKRFRAGKKRKVIRFTDGIIKHIPLWQLFYLSIFVNLHILQKIAKLKVW